MGAAPIVDVAQTCKNAFVSLLESGSQRPLVDLRDLEELREAIEDEQARLNTWAAHIGVFARHHSSLDYRLRESEKVRSLVTAQLEILRASQLKLLKILRPGKYPYTRRSII